MYSKEKQQDVSLNTFILQDQTVIDGVGVYHSRIQAGRYLAQDSPVEADLVVGEYQNQEMQQLLDIP